MTRVVSRRISIPDQFLILFPTAAVAASRYSDEIIRKARFWTVQRLRVSGSGQLAPLWDRDIIAVCLAPGISAPGFGFRGDEKAPVAALPGTGALPMSEDDLHPHGQIKHNSQFGQWGEYPICRGRKWGRIRLITDCWYSQFQDDVITEWQFNQVDNDANGELAGEMPSMGKGQSVV